MRTAEFIKWIFNTSKGVLELDVYRELSILIGGDSSIASLRIKQEKMNKSLVSALKRVEMKYYDAHQDACINECVTDNSFDLSRCNKVDYYVRLYDYFKGMFSIDKPLADYYEEFGQEMHIIDEHMPYLAEAYLNAIKAAICALRVEYVKSELDKLIGQLVKDSTGQDIDDVDSANKLHDIFRNIEMQTLTEKLIESFLGVDESNNAFSHVYYFMNSKGYRAFKKMKHPKNSYIDWVNQKYSKELGRLQSENEASADKRKRIFQRIAEDFITKQFKE